MAVIYVPADNSWERNLHDVAMRYAQQARQDRLARGYQTLMGQVANAMTDSGMGYSDIDTKDFMTLASRSKDPLGEEAMKMLTSMYSNIDRRRERVVKDPLMSRMVQGIDMAKDGYLSGDPNKILAGSGMAAVGDTVKAWGSRDSQQAYQALQERLAPHQADLYDAQAASYRGATPRTYGQRGTTPEDMNDLATYEQNRRIEAALNTPGKAVITEADAMKMFRDWMSANRGTNMFNDITKPEQLQALYLQYKQQLAGTGVRIAGGPTGNGGPLSFQEQVAQSLAGFDIDADLMKGGQ